MTVLEGMHSHLESRPRSNPYNTPPPFPRWHLAWLKSVGVRLRAPVFGAVCPTRRKRVLVLASTSFIFVRFPRFFFQLFFGDFFTQELVRGHSFSNNFSRAIHWIQARIALLSPRQVPAKGKAGSFPYSIARLIPHLAKDEFQRKTLVPLLISDRMGVKIYDDFFNDQPWPLYTLITRVRRIPGSNLRNVSFSVNR